MTEKKQSDPIRRATYTMRKSSLDLLERICKHYEKQTDNFAKAKISNIIEQLIINKARELKIL